MEQVAIFLEEPTDKYSEFQALVAATTTKIIIIIMMVTTTIVVFIIVVILTKPRIIHSNT